MQFFTFFIILNKKQVVLPRKFRTTSNCIPTLPALTKENSSTKLSNGSIAAKKATNGSSSSSSIPEDAAATDANVNGHQSKEASILHSPGQLLTRQALHTYQSNNHLVHYKYSAYSGSYHELPK